MKFFVSPFRRFIQRALIVLSFFGTAEFGWGQVYYDMSSGNKTWNFADIVNWANNFTSGIDAANWRSVGIIGSGTSVTTGTRTTKSSATFVTSSTGGLQKGTQAMVFLSTGSNATPEAVAVDLLLNFSGRTAGTLSFDWTALDNSSGTRPTSLRVFWTTDGTTFTEITGAQVLDQVSPSAGSITSVALPTQFNNSSTAVLRFYNHAGSITGSSNRDKMQIDNVAVTSTATSSSTPPTLTAANSPTVDASFNVTFTDNSAWRSAISAVKYGATTLTLNTDYTISAGAITLIPSGSAGSGLRTAGSATVTVVATGYSDATVTQAIGAGTATKLGMKTEPAAPMVNGGTLAAQPAVYIQDQYGNTTASTASVSAAVGSGTWTLGGSSSVSGVAGTATFSGLTATSAAAVTGATITFTSSALTSVTSGTFNIPAPAPANDLCASPTALTINGSSVNGTTVSATYTNLTAEPYNAYSDVWYSFTTASAGNVTIATNTTGVDYDIFVYSVCPSDATSHVSGGIAATGSTSSETLTFAASSSTSYLIRVVNSTSAVGNTFTIQATQPIPTISTTGTLVAVNTTYGTTSSNTSFSVSGSNLTGTISINPPAGYQVSTVSNFASNVGTNGTPITLTPTSGTVATTTIFVRILATTSVGSYAGNIALTSSGATSVNVATVSSTVIAKALTITGLTGANKTYDGLTAASSTGNAAYSGLVNSESFSVTGTPSFSFATPTVGTGKPITVSGYTAPSLNYTLSQPTLTGNITTAPLTITGITANDKSFDGTTVAALSGTPAYNGLVNNESFSVTGTPTASFVDAAVGNNKTVNVSGYTSPSSNYSLSQPTLTASITAATTPTISINGTPGAVNTTYGTASISPTSFAVSGSALTSEITITPPSGFEVSISTGSGYSSSLAITPANGTINTTTIYLRLAATTAAGTYSGNIVASSDGASEGTLATSSSTVNVKALTISGLTANNKVYDSSTSVTVTGTASYDGLVNNDSFTITDVVSFVFTTATVGSNKSITQTGTYSVPSSNYSITQPTLTANITQAPLTITASAQSKNFGVTSTTIGSSSFTSSGLQGSDAVSTVTLSYSGSGNSSTAVAGTYTITPSAPVFSTGSSSNYSITYVTGTLTINAVVPGAPTIGVPTAGNGQVSIAYTAPTSNGGSVITGYTATSSPGGFTGTVNQATSGSIVVTGLTNGIAYTFTVTATNSAGTSSSSSASASSTPRTVPDAPLIGLASVSGMSGTATIAFTAPSSNGGAAITSYTATSSPGNITGTLNQSGSGAITVSGLTNGTAYTFTVKANNAAGASASSSASNSVTPYTVPGAPTIGTATAGNGQATVSFTAPTSNGGSVITSYTATSSPGGITGTLSQSGSGTITVTGLTNGTAYTFTVTATNAAGTGVPSAASNSINVSLPAPTATAATSILANGFTANWDAVTNATGYKLDVGASSPIVSSSFTNVVSWDFPAGTATSAASGGITANNNKTLTTNATGAISYSATSASTLAALVNGWDAGSLSKYWQVDFATTGYYNVRVSSAQRSSNTGPRDFKLQYKIGSGGAWADVTSGAITTAVNFTTGVLSAVSLPSACDNQSSVFLRWIMTSNTSVNSGTVAAAGTSSIDNILIEGNAGSYISGYQDLTVSGTSKAVTGLSESTTYYYRVRATDGSQSANSNVITVTTKKTPTVTPIIGTYTYSGSAQGPNSITALTPTPTSVTYSYTGTGATTYGPSATQPTNAGSYTVTATVEEDANYISGSSSATAFTIGVATPVVTVTVGTYTYSGSGQGPDSATNTGTGTSYTFSYSGTGVTTYGPSPTKPTIAGSYTVVTTIAANGNYSSATSSATAFTITPASLTVAIADQTKCEGSTLNLTATNFTVGGIIEPDAVTSISYTSASNVVVGSYSIIPSVVGTGLANYTVSNSGTLTVTPHSWIGGPSGDWNTASNWCGGIPTIATNVVIPSSTVVTISAGAVANTITIAGTLSVASTGNLTVATNIVNSGTLDILSGGQLLQGSDTDISGGGQCIFRKELPQVTNSALSGYNRSYYIGSPVVGSTSTTPINITSVLGSSTTGLNMYGYTETNNTWPLYYSGSLQSQGSTFDIGKGYFVNSSSGTYFSQANFTGNSFNNGPVTVTLTNTAGQGGGYNLISNPYPSGINWSDIYNDASNTSLVGSSYWLRTYQEGAGMTYKTCNASGVSTQDLNTIISPATGFWVKYTGTSPGTFTFKNAMRTSGAGTYYTMNANRIIRLDLGNGAYDDQAVVYMNEDAGLGIESYDSDKRIPSTTVHQLYSLEGTTKLAINGFNNALAKDTVLLGMQIPTAGTYTINASQIDATIEEDIFLEDKITGAYQNLKTTPSYSFTSVAGTFNNRFVLHFAPFVPVLPGQTAATAIAMPTSNWPQCNNVTSEDQWHAFTATSEGISIEVNTASTDIVIELQDGTGNVVAQENAVNGIGNETLNFFGLTAGQTYKVGVRNNISSQPTGTYGICVKSLKRGGCDYGAGPYSLCQYYKATWAGSTGVSYTFTFTGTSGPAAGQTFTRTQNSDICVLSTVTPLLPYGSTYDVVISNTYTLTDGAGNTEQISVPSNNGCQVITIAEPQTTLSNNSSCNNGPRFRGAVVSSLPWVCGTNNWRWRFTEVNPLTMQTVGLPIELNRGAASNFLSLGSVPQLQNGKTYAVQTAPMFTYTGTNYNWGPVQYMCIVGAAQGMLQDASQDVAQGSTKDANAAQDVAQGSTKDALQDASQVETMVYVTEGNLLNIQLTNTASNSAKRADIYDVTGKLVKSVRLVEGMNEVTLTETAGIYMVRTVVGNQSETTRVFVNN